MLKEEGPDTMLNLFDGESDTPELIWDGTMRAELRKVAGHELNSLAQFRRETGGSNESFHLQPNVRVKYSKLENELFIGGVYVSRFLKEPTYNIRDPTSFLEMLLQNWTHELQMSTESEIKCEEKQSTDIILGGQDNLQSITDSIVYLCKIRTNLCDKLSQWGYMSRCLSFLETILSRDLLGSPLLSVMRVLHVAVNRRANVESLVASGANDRMHGIVAFTMRAVGDSGLHPDTGFMLEMLKKAFVETLGDVKSASKSPRRGQTAGYGTSYAMAPSPAPGEGPVSRNRVAIGNPLDDPLALGSGQDQGTAPSTTATALNAGPHQYGTQYQIPATDQYQMQSGFSNIQGHVGGQFSGNQFVQNRNQGSGIHQPTFQSHLTYGSSGQGTTLNGSHQQAFQNRQTFQGVPSSQSTVIGTNGGYQVQGGPAPRGDSFGQVTWPAAQQPPPVQEPYQQQSYQYTQQLPQSHQYQIQGGNTSSYAQRSAVSQQRMTAQQTLRPPTSIQQQVPAPSVGTMYGQISTSSQATYQPSLQDNRNTFSDPRVSSTSYPNQYSSSRLVPNTKQDYSQFQQNWQSSSQVPGAELGSQQLLYQQSPSNLSGQVQAPTNQYQQPPSTLLYNQNATQESVGKHDSPNLQNQQSPPQQSFQQSTRAGIGTNFAGTQIGERSHFQHPASQFQQPAAVQPNQEQFAAQVTQQPIAPQSNQQKLGTQTAQQYHPYQQPQESAVPSFPVETVSGNEDQGMSQLAHPVPLTEGTGVDARTAPEPSVEAAKMAATAEGAPGCAEGRRALLESAIVCDLPRFLVESVLENQNLSRVKDPASVKVHAVELLKLLLVDPGYGMKFQLIMENIPAWKKYVSQDHSLFITGPEQKTDYFLTDGGSSDPKKLLTQG